MGPHVCYLHALSHSLPRRPWTRNSPVWGPRQGHRDPVGQEVQAPHWLLCLRSTSLMPVPPASPRGPFMPNVLPVAASDEQASAPAVSGGAVTQPARVLAYVVKTEAGALPHTREHGTRLAALSPPLGSDPPHRRTPGRGSGLPAAFGPASLGGDGQACSVPGLPHRKGRHVGTFRMSRVTSSAWKQLASSTRGKKVDGHRPQGLGPGSAGPPATWTRELTPQPGLA